MIARPVIYTNGHVDDNTARLYRQLATVRAENVALRDKLNYGQRGSSIVRRAIVDAHSILLAAFSDQSTSIKAMGRNHGMSKRRWGWAVAFLRYVGIVSAHNRNWRAGLEFIITILSDAVALLERGARELLESAAGYQTLARYLRDS